MQKGAADGAPGGPGGWGSAVPAQQLSQAGELPPGKALCSQNPSQQVRSLETSPKPFLVSVPGQSSCALQICANGCMHLCTCVGVCTYVRVYRRLGVSTGEMALLCPSQRDTLGRPQESALPSLLLPQKDWHRWLYAESTLCLSAGPLTPCKRV